MQLADGPEGFKARDSQRIAAEEFEVEGLRSWTPRQLLHSWLSRTKYSRKESHKGRAFLNAASRSAAVPFGFGVTLILDQIWNDDAPVAREVRKAFMNRTTSDPILMTLQLSKTISCTVGAAI